jgi:hypothetical protein
MAPKFVEAFLDRIGRAALNADFSSVANSFIPWFTISAVVLMALFICTECVYKRMMAKQANPLSALDAELSALSNDFTGLEDEVDELLRQLDLDPATLEQLQGIKASAAAADAAANGGVKRKKSKENSAEQPAVHRGRTGMPAQLGRPARQPQVGESVSVSGAGSDDAGSAEEEDGSASELSDTEATRDRDESGSAAERSRSASASHGHAHQHARQYQQRQQQQLRRRRPDGITQPGVGELQYSLVDDPRATDALRRSPFVQAWRKQQQQQLAQPATK